MFSIVEAICSMAKSEYEVIDNAPYINKQSYVIVGDYLLGYKLHPTGLQKSTHGQGRSPKGQLAHAVLVSAKDNTLCDNKKTWWLDVDTQTTTQHEITCPRCLNQIKKRGLQPATCITVISNDSYL